MSRINFHKVRLGFALIALSVILSGCASSAKSKYFGSTEIPKTNVFKYISGSEPESLDPQIPTGQPEARIITALFDGLVDYHPKTQLPIPGIAKSWEPSPNLDEFIFHLRDNAKWSDGTPITANDFVYSIRRGFTPETLSRTAELGYFIKYAEAFNGGRVFVKKGDQFLLEKDFSGDAATQKTDASPNAKSPNATSFGAETEFHKFIKSPDRLTLEADEKKRAKELEANPKLKAAVEGAEFVPIKAEEIGVEAIDDYTLRITLRQSVPFFVGLMTHQFFKLIPKHVVEKYGKDWTRAEHIVTCGPFKIKEIRPYDAYITVKDPNYWDAANVHLDGIEFYPVEDTSTQMNLYRAGSVDALYNHTVPASWIDEIRNYKSEYMDYPESATAYYSMNMTKPPFNDKRVRQAFSLTVDRVALAKYRKVYKPLYFQTPSGIFPDYDKAMQKVGEEIRQQRGIAPEDWTKLQKQLDPERARKLLTEAGFPVIQNGNTFSCPTFPTDKVSLTYNTTESNRQVAEFVQNQWKQNLGITIPLKNMEFKTFLPMRNALEFDGFAQSLWSGDYMDPYTFLGLHYGKQNNGAAGFYDPKYDQMLDDANRELDPQLRYEKLARAEYYLLDQVPSVPLNINATSWMKKPYVKGMYPNPGTMFSWKFVYLEPDPNKWDEDGDKVMSESDPQYEAQIKALENSQKKTENAK